MQWAVISRSFWDCNINSHSWFFRETNGCYWWFVKNFLLDAGQKCKSRRWRTSPWVMGISGFFFWEFGALGSVRSPLHAQREGSKPAALLPWAWCGANCGFPRQKSSFYHAGEKKGCLPWPRSSWQSWIKHCLAHLSWGELCWQSRAGTKQWGLGWFRLGLRYGSRVEWP